jgi:hypothetical protein
MSSPIPMSVFQRSQYLDHYFMRRALRGPRFTIRRLMVLVVIVAVLLWLIRYVDGVPFALALRGFVLAFICWAWARGWRRRAAIFFVGSVAAANVLVAPLSIYFAAGWVFVCAGLGLFVGIPMILGFGTAWSFADTRSHVFNGRPPKLSWPFLSFFLAISMAITPLVTLWTFWPLRAAFLISLPALDRLADRVAAGQTVPFPVRAGLFRVVGSATDPKTGSVGLITNSNPSGRSGFVRYPPVTTSVPGSGPLHSLFMGMSLSQRWTFEVED